MKIKLKGIKMQVSRIQQKYEEENIIHEHRLNAMFDNMRKIETILKDSYGNLEI